jgi:uncharacterized protein (TIGR02118 family)
VKVKVIGFVKKRDDMTRRQFRDYWLNEHGKLACKSLENNPVRRIVASFVTEELVGETPFDGMVELYFDSLEDMRAQWSGPQDEIMREDEGNFCDPGYRVFALTEEYRIAER